MRNLEEYKRNSSTFNGFLITFLPEIKATQAVTLMEDAFETLRWITVWEATGKTSGLSWDY